MQSRTDDMPGKPVLNISYHVIPMDGDRVQFRKAHDVFVIKRPGLLELVRDLFPLLDGARWKTSLTNCRKNIHGRASSACCNAWRNGMWSKRLWKSAMTCQACPAHKSCIIPSSHRNRALVWHAWATP